MHDVLNGVARLSRFYDGRPGFARNVGPVMPEIIGKLHSLLERGE